MAGFREFRSGEVWFYYNPHATKKLEKQRDTGAVTSRPVVILQDAFYPEWNDVITVVPMTHSDRRSGVYIDTTILNDGTMITGGTVLPYLMYTIRTKYLFPMTSDGAERKKILSLDRRDFAAVKNGVAYHLGLSDIEPDYIEHWKHLNDYERSIVIQNAKLAVTDWGLDSTPESYPTLMQEKPLSAHVKNHIVAAYDTLDDSRNFLSSKKTKSESIVLPTHTPSEDIQFMTISELRAKKARMVTLPGITFTRKSTSAIIQTLAELYDADGNWQVHGNTERIQSGSTFLQNVSPSNAADEVTVDEAIVICGMTLSDIVKNTGVGSTSTASRLRKSLREHFKIDNDDTFIPAPYICSGGSTTKFKCQTNARRRIFMFGQPKEELLALLSMSDMAVQDKYASLSLYDVRTLKSEIAGYYKTQYMEDFNIVDESVAAPIDFDNVKRFRYPYWDTLSKHELAEISSCSKRNVNSIANKFSVNRDALMRLRTVTIQLSRKTDDYRQSIINDSRAERACILVLQRKINDVDIQDLHIFCRTDHDIIYEYACNAKIANTPSKSHITKIKNIIRKHIATKP